MSIATSTSCLSSFKETFLTLQTIYSEHNELNKVSRDDGVMPSISIEGNFTALAKN